MIKEKTENKTQGYTCRCGLKFETTKEPKNSKHYKCSDCDIRYWMSPDNVTVRIFRVGIIKNGGSH